MTTILPSCYADCANGDNNGNRCRHFGAGADFYRRRSIVTKIIQHIGTPKLFLLGNEYAHHIFEFQLERRWAELRQHRVVKEQI
jgi:hypothetical protein